MIIPNVFLTVTSNAGISIAQVGSLAVGTSNNIEDLLGSSITALKDIIGSEASQTEARVMSGTTDHSAFGTISLKLDNENSLSVTYLITVPPGEELPFDLIPFVDEFARAFGYQLLQISLLKRYLEMGKQLPHDAIAWAFLNASIVAHLLSPQIPEITKYLDLNIRQIISKVLTSCRDLKPLTQLKNEDYLLSHPEYWKEEFLKPSFAYSLKQQLLDEALWKIVNENTLRTLLFPEPKRIPLFLKIELNEFIKKTIPEPEKEVIKNLKNSIIEETNNIHSELDISYSHAIHKVVRENAIRKAIVKAISENPLLAVANLRRRVIRQKFEEIYVAYKYVSVSEVLIDAIKPLLNKRNLVPVEVFISTFFETLREYPITNAGWAALNSFLLSMSGHTEQIIENAKKICYELGKPKWAEQINYNLRIEPQEALPLTQVEEAQIIWKAIANASMSSLAILIKQEYFGDLPKTLGFIPQKITRSYYKHAKYILIATMIREIIRILHDNNFTVSLSIPSTSLIISLNYLKQKKLKYKTKNVNFKRKKIFFKNSLKIVLDDEDVYAWQINNKNYKNNLLVIIDKNTIKSIEELEIQPHEIFKTIKNTNFLIYTIQVKMAESIYNKVIQPIIKIVKTNPILLTKGKLTEHIKINKEEKEQYPLKQYLKDLEKKSSHIQSKLKKAISKNANNSSTNTKEKLAQEIEKELINLMLKSLKELTKILKKKEKQFSSLSDIKSNSHVLKYQDITSESLLLKEEDLSKIIQRKIEEKNRLFLSDQIIPLLKATIANYLFDPVPESIISDAINILSKNKNKKSRALIANKNIDDLLLEHHLSVPDLLTIIKIIISTIERELVANDAPIAVEKSSVYVELFSIRSKIIPDPLLFSQILPYEPIETDLVAGRWIGKIKLLDLDQFRSEIPLLVTFSDVIRYGVLQETRSSINLVYSGIGLIIKYLNRESPNLLNQLKDNLEESLFKT